MREKNNFTLPYTTDIPKLFWSDLNAAPFEKCIQCEKELLELGSPYLIEKAVRGFDGEKVASTIFEYAICITCAESMQMKLSESSRRNIDSFFKSAVDFKERRDALAEEEESKWLENCLIHKEPVTSEGECQLYGLCQGNQFIYYEFPYMIRSEAIDEMMDLISAETLDQLGDFKNDLIDGPPELKELFEKGGPRVLV